MDRKYVECQFRKLQSSYFTNSNSQKEKNLPGNNRHREAEMLLQQAETPQEICSKRKGETRKEPVVNKLKQMKPPIIFFVSFFLRWLP